MPSDVSSISQCIMPFGQQSDQDDIVWYKVPANGQMIANILGSYGTYLVHTYGVLKAKWCA